MTPTIKSSAQHPWVYFECQHHVFATSISAIEQLVLADEVKRLRTRAAATTTAVPVVQVATRRYAAWNLGRMLELNASSSAWILLRIQHAGAELPLAVAVDRCLMVGPERQVTPLPPSMFRLRSNAMSGVFAADDFETDGVAAVAGFCMKPEALWTDAELETSAASLVSALAD